MLIGGRFPDIPLFTGYTANEFITNLPKSAEATDGDGGKIAADIVEKNGIKTINIVENTVKTVAKAHVRNGKRAGMYIYRFGPDIPGDDDPGAFHSCDLWFFFETIQKCWRPYNGTHYALARRMCDHWTNFIKTGDPNGTGYDGKTLPVWKKCSSDDPAEDEMMFS